MNNNIESKPAYVAIVGTRPTKDPKQNERTQAAVYAYVKSLPGNTVIISGGAPGVDTWATEAAAALGLPEPVVFPADWKTHGNSAGMRRNPLIVNAADRLVAFWDGQSKGTKNSIDLAKKRGIPVVINPEADKPADSAALFNQLFNPETVQKPAASLVTTQPSYIFRHTLESWDLYTVYYGVPDGKPELLPLGAHYGVVYSPGPFTPATRAGWRYCRFKVVLAHSRFKGGKPIDEPSRMYREVKGSNRYLTEAEVNHLIFVIENTFKGLQAG